MEKKISHNGADVSVVIPHYNATDTISRALTSIVAQTFKVKEVIIVDDASHDFDLLLSIIKRFEGAINIKTLRIERNAGASYARNKGVEIATARYIAFLDADDIWDARKIEIQYEVMESSNAHLSGHDYVMDLNRKQMILRINTLIKQVTLSDFIWKNPFFTPTVMVKKDKFIKFDARYRRVDDYHCWLMNVKAYDAIFIRQPLAAGFKPAIGSSGLTGSITCMHKSYTKVLRDLYREGHVRSLFYLLAISLEIIKFPLRVIRYRLLRNKPY